MSMHKEDSRAPLEGGVLGAGEVTGVVSEYCSQSRGRLSRPALCIRFLCDQDRELGVGGAALPAELPV